MTAALTGCNFDSMTAKAVHGKNIIVMITDSTGADPIAISGQQGLTFSMEAETSEAATKDSAEGWAVKFPGIKSWNASVDGLFCFDDESRNKLVKSIVDGQYLCFGIYKREKVDNSIKYTPVRKGLAIATSDEIDAPHDDNMTYAVNFEGSGEPWLIETHTAEEIEAATITVEVSTGGENTGDEAQG